MTEFKNFNYSLQEVSAIVADSTNGEFLWIAFKQNASGNCKLYKVSANNPNQIYFSIDLAVTEIKRMKIDGNYLYVAVEDDTYLAYRYSLSNPLTSNTTLAIPSGVTEAPVDIGIETDYLDFLTPGTASGSVPKIVRVAISTFALDQVINIEVSGEDIENASSITVSSGDNIWVVTRTSPSKLIRIYESSGSIFLFQVHEIS